jgi:hypothetical protein
VIQTGKDHDQDVFNGQLGIFDELNQVTVIEFGTKMEGSGYL